MQLRIVPAARPVERPPYAWIAFAAAVFTG